MNELKYIKMFEVVNKNIFSLILEYVKSLYVKHDIKNIIVSQNCIYFKISQSLYIYLFYINEKAIFRYLGIIK